ILPAISKRSGTGGIRRSAGRAGGGRTTHNKDETTMTKTTAAIPSQAVIYCRVSSKKQATGGHGLDSQELRCREYAHAKGYAIAAVFTDDVSGGGDFMKRPGMVALLRYLETHAD